MKLIYRHLWKHIHVLDKPNKKSSWLELLFDLIYVIIFSSCINFGLKNFNLWTTLELFTIVVLSLQIWLSVSMFSAIVNMLTWKMRFSMFGQIFLLIILNYSIVNFKEQTLLFYLVIIINYLYRIFWLWKVKNSNSNFKYVIKNTSIMCLLVFIGILICYFWKLNLNNQEILLSIIAFLVLINGFINKINAKSSSVLSLLEFMSERWGLIILIVLAEVLISSTNAFNHYQLNALTLLSLATNIFYILNLWTMYYDQISHIGIAKNKIQIWSAFHIILVFVLIIIGILTRIWIDLQIHNDVLAWSWTICNFLIFILFACIRYFSVFESQKLAKKFWNKQKKNQILTNIGLGLLYLLSAPLFIYKLKIINTLGLNIAAFMLISNYLSSHKFALFLDKYKNNKNTIKSWEELDK